LGSIPRQIEGVQFGSIQAYVGPPEFLVGVDERYEVMSAPGLVTDIDHGIRVATDPAVKAMVLGLGADKGLHGVALFISQPSAIIARTPIRHLTDLKGKKLRVLAAQFQQEMLTRLGATPVAMTLGDVLPAIQQGALDGAVAVVTVYTTMQYQDAAKYVTETGQPFVFSGVYVSRKWYDALTKDLQRIIDSDADKSATAVNPWERNFYEAQRKVWTDRGGELINLPPEEQSAMMESIASIGGDLSKSKPALHQAYEVLVAAANRTRQ
jgi:TRAP-type C4-dicarboxylate transport system substrate-binding protein